MHRLDGDALSAEPIYKKRSTVGTYDISFPQAAGGIHVHPNGRTVYLANRANATVDFNGKKVFRGGENNMAVFSIHPATGEPTLIQNEDPQSFHIRKFSIDPSGKLLIAASIVDMHGQAGDNTRHLPETQTASRTGSTGNAS